MVLMIAAGVLRLARFGLREIVVVAISSRWPARSMASARQYRDGGAPAIASQAKRPSLSRSHGTRTANLLNK